MPVDIVLEDGTRTTINVRHHQWHVDEPAEAGGTDTAPTPGEMMLGALGSCMAITCPPLCRAQRLGPAARRGQAGL